MAKDNKISIGMRLRPDFYEQCKYAAWRERMPFAHYVEHALEKLMKEQGHWPKDKSGSPDVGLSTSGEGDGIQTSRKGRG